MLQSKKLNSGLCPEFHRIFELFKYCNDFVPTIFCSMITWILNSLLYKNLACNNLQHTRNKQFILDIKHLMKG